GPPPAPGAAAPAAPAPPVGAAPTSPVPTSASTPAATPVVAPTAAPAVVPLEPTPLPRPAIPTLGTRSSGGANGATTTNGAALVLLSLLLIFGHGQEEYGAQRWLGVGQFALQPSEPAKLALILALARFFADGATHPLTLRRLLASLTLVLLPVALVYLQPDLGTAVSFLAIWVGVVVVAGARA